MICQFYCYFRDQILFFYGNLPGPISQQHSLTMKKCAVCLLWGGDKPLPGLIRENNLVFKVSYASGIPKPASFSSEVKLSFIFPCISVYSYVMLLLDMDVFKVNLYLQCLESLHGNGRFSTLFQGSGLWSSSPPSCHPSPLTLLKEMRKKVVLPITPRLLSLANPT